MERARAHIGRAAEQHQTRFATRLAPGVRLPRDQPDGAKADMPPACTFGCDVKQGAVAGRWVRFDAAVHAATLSRPSRAALRSSDRQSTRLNSSHTCASRMPYSDCK